MLQELSISEEHSKESIEEPPPKKFKASTGYVSVLSKKENIDAPAYKKEISTTNSTNISKM